MSVVIFLFKQKTAYGMRSSDGSSDVCSSDLDDITAHLRRQPQSAMEIAQAGQADGALALARTRLREGVAAYVDGDAGLARDKVLSAYLDGVEPAEPLIGTRDTALLRELETAMASVRAAIGNGADAAEVQARAEAAEALLGRAEATIRSEEHTSELQSLMRHS